MTSAPRPSLGRRLYLMLFKIMGPADVGRSGPPAVKNPADPTVPPGYHLETVTDANGIKRRIAVPNDRS